MICLQKHQLRFFFFLGGCRADERMIVVDMSVSLSHLLESGFANCAGKHSGWLGWLIMQKRAFITLSAFSFKVEFALGNMPKMATFAFITSAF